MTFFLQFIIVLRAFGRVEIRSLMTAIALIFFIKTALPISIGDLCVREVASVTLFAPLGIQKAAALNASLLHFFITFFIPAIIGGIVVGFKRREEIPSDSEENGMGDS